MRILSNLTILQPMDLPHSIPLQIPFQSNSSHLQLHQDCRVQSQVFSSQPTQPQPQPEIDESEDEDLHVCGSCKTEFKIYSVFRAHKTMCNKRKKVSNAAQQSQSPNLNSSDAVDQEIRSPSAPLYLQNQEEINQQVCC